MHDKHGLIQNRLKRVLVERIIPAIHTPVAALELTAWHVEGGQGEPVDPAVALGLAPAATSAAGTSPVKTADDAGTPAGAPSPTRH